MSETKFTPGPWTASRSYPDRLVQSWYVTRPKAGVISIIPAFSPSSPAEANAHLIAASPELYAALEQSNGLIERAQEILSDYLRPDGLSADDALNNLLGLLDGPDQRRIQGSTRSALSRARGETT